MKIYIQNRTIVVENVTEPICIYNMLGFPVAQGTKTEFSMPNAEAYIVKIGKKATTAVIK